MVAEMIRASAPGRCGIVGNPTDMYGGSVMACSVPRRATVKLQEADALTLVTRDQELVLRGPDDYVRHNDLFDLPKVALRHMHMLDARLRIEYDSDIPFQGGLSGSTALLAALTAALLEYNGTRYPRHYFAEFIRFIELNRMGIMCGYQDAYMVTFGGLNYMEFRDKEYFRPSVDEELFATIESLDGYASSLPFILAHTGVQHMSGAVHKPLRERWEDGDAEVVEAYKHIASLGRQGKRAFLMGDYDLLGRLMNENHAIQRDLGGSGPANERLIAAALDAGALGAKLAGAGRGGTIIALHPDPHSLEAPLLAAGAELIMYPTPTPGVVAERI
jgi:galactokinase/mevalonate kinase-like predicted kinase